MSATSLPRLNRDLAPSAVCRDQGPIAIPLNPSPLNAALALPLSCHSPFSYFYFLHSITPFRINTCENSRKCCIQRTYRIAKSFRFRTYKKQGVGGVMVNQESDNEVDFSQDCHIEDSYFSSQTIGSRQTASMSDIGREQGWAGRCPSSRRRASPTERVLKF